MRIASIFTATALSLGIAGPALADDLIVKSSPHSVDDTMDALEGAVSTAGATIFARVDHTEGAMGVDMELAESQLLIFGNPQLGTPVMQENIQAGLVLPLRVLIYADEEGTTQVAYVEVEEMLEDFDVDDDLEAVEKMESALEMLTDKAVE